MPNYIRIPMGGITWFVNSSIFGMKEYYHFYYNRFYRVPADFKFLGSMSILNIWGYGVYKIVNIGVFNEVFVHGVYGLYPVSTSYARKRSHRDGD